MACEDIKLYLQEKKPSLDLSFINIIKNIFLLEDDLELKLISDKRTKLYTIELVASDDQMFENLLICLLLDLILLLRTLLVRMLLPLTPSNLLLKI